MENTLVQGNPTSKSVCSVFKYPRVLSAWCKLVPPLFIETSECDAPFSGLHSSDVISLCSSGEEEQALLAAAAAGSQAPGDVTAPPPADDVTMDSDEDSECSDKMMLGAPTSTSW